MRRRLLPLALAVMVLPRLAGADVPGFAFLEVPAGARAAALGGAYASLAEGVEAAFWNPAGLEGTHGSQVTAAHTEFLQQLRHDQFAVAGRMFGGAASASLRAFYSEPIDERDELGNLIGTFGTHDLELALGYGRAATRSVRLGGTVQLVRERIADAATMTWAMNLGGTWDPPALAGARLSLSGHNLGPSPAYTIDGVKGEAIPLPAALHAGVSYGPPPAARGFALRGALEARLTRGRSGVGMVGAELSGLAGTAFRAGFRVGDPATSMSLGAGWSTKGLKLDYAWVPFRLDLGDTHRFGITAQF